MAAPKEPVPTRSGWQRNSGVRGGEFPGPCWSMVSGFRPMKSLWPRVAPRLMPCHLVAIFCSKDGDHWLRTLGVNCCRAVMSSRIQTLRPWVAAIRSPSRG